eukprot:12342_1
MAEEAVRLKQFEYKANSNLVLQADRSKRRSDEPTGEVETLWGKTGSMRMGDKVHSADSRPAELEAKLGKAKDRQEANRDAEEEKRERDAKRQRQKVFVAEKGATVLTETADMDNINYRPKTRETRAAYEEMLAFVQGKLGAQPQDILRGAAEEVVSILKDDVMNDIEGLKEIRRLLAGVSQEDHAKLVGIGKRITDFSVNTEEDNSNAKADESSGDEGMDEDMGVAVVFDEEDEEEEDDNDVDEVRDSEDEDEDVGGEEAGRSRQLKGGREGMDEDEEDEKDMLRPEEVDAHWLQRCISRYYDDANVSAKLSEDVLAALGIPEERSCENKLVVLLDYDKFDFIKMLLKNRWVVFHVTRLRQAQTDEEREKLTAEVASDVASGGPSILTALAKTESASSWNADRIAAFGKKTMREARALAKTAQEEGGNIGYAGENGMMSTVVEVEEEVGASGGSKQKTSTIPMQTQALDLDSMAFTDGGHTMTNKTCQLPEDSWRLQKKGYEEVHVPAVKHVVSAGEKKMPIDALPEWCHPAFEGMETLNRIQTKMHKAALFGSKNLLLCAPTGAGKTNVAMLCMLHEIGQRRAEDGSIDLDAFKIVYVAPMKALVQEVVLNFSERLSAYGMTVKELSGDASLSRQQLQETQVIVTTPEKWDIVTRKAGDRTFTQMVKLIVIDEIHLLHDERGPVLESIVARTMRQVETTQEMIRIVGLSATLPNFEDVAAFLRVPADEGLFYFDNSFRPIPLQQQYIGVTEKKAIRRFSLMNDLCYEKVMAQAGRNQVLIFVHSRNETMKTARAVRDMCMENDTLGTFIKEGSATSEVLREESENVKSDILKDLLPYGFGIHHAGMARSDRNLVEDLFSDRHLQVLVSTATLAWGVNLPAHTVILKGTQMYSPDKGEWVELSPLDVLQMMGRAGRPQYDTEGEGIVITSYAKLQFYLSLNNQQLPVESQMLKRLPDQMNAEIVSGAVSSVREAADWLGYTYLYVRMLRSPDVYGLPSDALDSDPTLLEARINLAYEAASQLDKDGLVKFDRRSGTLQATPLGRVASYYYIVHKSMAKYNRDLKPIMSMMELMRVFAISEEFRLIHVREEEKPEMRKLAMQVPYPIKDSFDEGIAKVNVLLQAYIARFSLDGYALNSDMVYIQQSACRIFRALFEVALKRGWADLATKTLTLCKLVERRCWESMSPLRQFKGIPEILVKKLERKAIPWVRYLDLKPPDLGELIKNQKMGKQLHALIHQFPKLDLNASVQPITRGLLRIELIIQPDFTYDAKVHEGSLMFHVLVEDVDGINILHHEPFFLNKSGMSRQHVLTFVVPISDPILPQYFIKVISDRWLHSESVLPISFRHLLLPSKQPPYTELLDLQPIPVSALGRKDYMSLYAPQLETFNPVQTQVFGALYEGDDNVLVCTPEGSGRHVYAEFAILRHWNMAKEEGSAAVYIAPRHDIAKRRWEQWQSRFEPLQRRVVLLTGESAADIPLLESCDIAISTAEHWDMLSRRWKQRRAVQDVGLFIVDDLQLMGGENGPVLEVCVSRMRYMSSELDKNARIIGLSASLANARDVADWLFGNSRNSVFSFHPAVRPVPLELRLQSFEVGHFSSRMLAMAKPAYSSAISAGSSIIFVPSRRQSQLTAIDMITFAAANGETFLGKPEAACTLNSDLKSYGIKEDVLKTTLCSGVGFVHVGMKPGDVDLVVKLFQHGTIKCLVVHYAMCWRLEVSADTVVLMGTQSYSGHDRHFVDYPVSDLLHMVGMGGRQKDGVVTVDSGAGGGKCHVFCYAPKKVFLRRVLDDALPIESHLDHCLADHLNAEIVTKTVQNKQDAVIYLTWTFLYRRLSRNPGYYGMSGISNQHKSNHLSELVEQTVSDLEEARCVEIEDDMNLSSLNLGMIAAYYYISCDTIELFANSVTAKTKQRGLLDILSSATEFAKIPLRQKEDIALQMVSKELPQKVPDDWSFEDAPAKVHVLLQSHFDRKPLGLDLLDDQRNILQEVPRLLSAFVDVISSCGWLKPALGAMELSQMVVQGVWSNDSYLRQIPHLDADVLELLKAEGLETPFDIMDMEGDKRNSLLKLDNARLADVAHFCNAFPNIELDYEIQEADDIISGEPVSLVVTLERELDEDDKPLLAPPQAVAPLYPKPKSEGWWIVVGDRKNNALLAVKRVNLASKSHAKLGFMAPLSPGVHKLVLLLMSDSYTGADQEYEFKLDVKPDDEQGDSDKEEGSGPEPMDDKEED